MRQKDKSVYKIAMTGLLAALSYVAFTFLQIKIMLPGGDATSFHLGNTICVLGALLAGTMSGSLGGAIGMTIGDLLDPVYVIYAPKTFILKMLIGRCAGYAAGIGHLPHGKILNAMFFNLLDTGQDQPLPEGFFLHDRLSPSFLLLRRPAGQQLSCLIIAYL